MDFLSLLVTVIFPLALSIGLGLGTMGDPESFEFWVARCGFIVSALALGGAYAYWLYEEPRAVKWLIVWGSVAGIYCAVALPLELRWLDQRHARIKALQAAAAIQAASVSTAKALPARGVAIEATSVARQSHPPRSLQQAGEPSLAMRLNGASRYGRSRRQAPKPFLALVLARRGTG
jgi:hypothetical protein